MPVSRRETKKRKQKENGEKPDRIEGKEESTARRRTTLLRYSENRRKEESEERVKGRDNRKKDIGTGERKEARKKTDRRCCL